MKTEFNLDELLRLHIICRSNVVQNQTRADELNEASECDEITDAEREDYRRRAESYFRAVKEVDELSEKIWQYLINYTEL